MKSLILWSLAIVMMFSGVKGGAMSQSCSSVNGKMICTSDQSDGNFAGSSSGAFSNGQSSYQQSSSGTGNTYTGSSSSSSMSQGNMPAGGFVGPMMPGMDPFAAVGLPNPMQMFGFGR